jgi:4'-phosphopantetheinyl transferase
LPADDEVLLWTLALDAFEGVVAQLEGLLAPAERDRARGLPARRRREFVTTRATLRAALAERLGTPPANIALSLDPDGKPVLDSPRDLHFSISHTSGLGLVALSGRPVGVDVEEVRPRERLERVAARVFAAADRKRLGELRGREQLEFFYAAWTAREARLKAGPGIGELTLRHFAPAPGYLAAVAVEGAGLRIVPQARSL